MTAHRSSPCSSTLQPAWHGMSKLYQMLAHNIFRSVSFGYERGVAICRNQQPSRILTQESLPCQAEQVPYHMI